MTMKSFKLTPLQILVGGYFLITLCGAVLLSLPISSARGTCQPFLDSLFLATSGISTSGLTVVDIGSYYSLFGQVVLMGIFQIGGIGYMTFIIFVAYLLGEKISLWTGITAKESLATQSYGYKSLGRFFKNVLSYTLLFEFIGAAILAVYWTREFSVTRAIYLGIFHSVSAFCTAGFSPFASSMMKYQNSLTVNLTINLISLIGGIGFFVLTDIFDYAHKKLKQLPARLTLHSKMALLVTVAVIAAGTIGIMFTEHWPANSSYFDRANYAVFQAVSASTTDGFNSIDIGAMSASGLTILIVLMFIGASPGSTGGGIKTTTLGAMFTSMAALLRGKRSSAVFERELPVMTIIRAFTVFSLFVMIAVLDMIVMAGTEQASYLRVFFEIISALGNTGLSTGITASLSAAGKIMLIITMFIGRVGPVSIAMAFFARKHNEAIKCPQEDMFVG